MRPSQDNWDHLLGFAATRGKGFHITFANGWTASVQFGEGNYCERRDAPDEKFHHSSPNAEIACWDASGTFQRMESGDDVRGWMGPKEVLNFLIRVEGMKEGATANKDAWFA